MTKRELSLFLFSERQNLLPLWSKTDQSWKFAQTPVITQNGYTTENDTSAKEQEAFCAGFHLERELAIPKSPPPTLQPSSSRQPNVKLNYRAATTAAGPEIFDDDGWVYRL